MFNNSSNESHLAQPQVRVEPFIRPCKLQDTSLYNLPPEIIHKIFSYIDPLYLHRVVSLVCRKFNSILQWDPMWRKAFHENNSLTSTNYPYLHFLDMYSTRWKSGMETNWRDLCVSMEVAKSNWFTNCSKVSFPVCEYIVDVVHVLDDCRYCVTGARERTLTLWDVHNCMETYQVSQAHGGWVSGIDSTNHLIMTSGWDSYVKLWAITNSCVVPLGKACLQLAVMDVVGRREMLAACTFPDLFLIDPRIGRPDSYFNFSMEVGCLNHLKFWRDNYIILSSRRKKLIHFDLRMQRTLKSVEIATESSPRTMAVRDDLVFIGDNSGHVYLYDINNGFNFVERYDVSQSTSQVRTVIPMKGYMFVGTSDGNLQVVSLMKENNEMKLIATDNLHAEISSGHYSNGVLAVVMTTSMSSCAATIYTAAE